MVFDDWRGSQKSLEQIGNDNWGQQPYMNGYLNERYIFLGLSLRPVTFATFFELKSV